VFAFDSVIEEGSYDDFKECILALVWLPPWRGVHKLKANWTVEVSQDLVCLHGIRADAVLVKALNEALKRERGCRAPPRRIRSVDRRGGESILHQNMEW
jgi:hypothetical protein